MPACRDWRRQRVCRQAMIIGVPKEIKDHEFRVGLTPEGTRALVKAGHRVLVEAGAGGGSGFDDAAYRPLTEALLDRRVFAIAYETVERPDGGLPILRPMSEVAGRLSVQIGAHYLERTQGGRGVLLGGVPGVAPGKVVILGAGVVGTHATQMAVGLGAHVTVFNLSRERLEALDTLYQGRVTTMAPHPEWIEQAVLEADLVN